MPLPQHQMGNVTIGWVHQELDHAPHIPIGGYYLGTSMHGQVTPWNTLEFPPGSGAFQILEYSQGRMASPGDFTGS